MTRLRAKVRRDLWRMRWRALAIVLTLASGIAVDAGAFMGVFSLLHTRDSVYSELHFADLEIRFLPDDARNLPDVSHVAGVTRMERRLVYPGIIRPQGKAPVTVVLTSLETPTPGIHSFQFLAGRPFRPDELDAVVIDTSLATYHGYRVGDTFDIKVGEATYTRRVVGIVITPEYFVSTSNPTYFVPERGSLGFVFGNLDAMTDRLGFVLVNDLVFLIDPMADAETVKQAILTRLSKLNIDQVSPRARHFGYQYVQMQLESVRVYIPALLAVLIGLTFIVISINVSRMVAAERRGIGGLMALGYGTRPVLGAYLEGTLILCVFGAALGLLASIGVRNFFASTSAISMGMPLVRVTFDIPTMIRSVGYQVAVALVATAIPVLRLLRLPAQQVIREAPRSFYSPHESASWIVAAMERLPVSTRYALRNISRQRVRAAVTVASIGLALGVAIAYRLSAASLDVTLTHWLERDRWTQSVDFLYPVFLDRMEDLHKLPGVRRVEPYLSCYVQATKDGRTADSTMVGITPETELVNINPVAGRVPRASTEREVVLTRELSRRLGVGVGDRFQVETMGQASPVHLVGLSWAAVAGLSIVPFTVAQDVCQLTDKASGAYLELAPGHEAMAAYDLEFVGKVLRKQDLLAQIHSVLASLITLIGLAVVVGLFVATLVVLTSINLSVLENERDFGTLQALGYGRRMIATAILTEALVYAVSAVLLAVPIGAAISIYLNREMGAAWLSVENAFPGYEFIVVLGPALLLIPLGCYPGIRYVVSRAALASIRSRTLD